MLYEPDVSSQTNLAACVPLVFFFPPFLETPPGSSPPQSWCWLGAGHAVQRLTGRVDGHHHGTENSAGAYTSPFTSLTSPLKGGALRNLGGVG